MSVIKRLFGEHLMSRLTKNTEQGIIIQMHNLQHA